MNIVAERLKKAMELRGMRQVELSEKTGIGKSSLSVYMSGDYKPKQSNLYKLAKALDVNPAWLMGEDVPMYELRLDWFGEKRGFGNYPKQLEIKCHSVPLIDHTEAGDPIITWVEYYTQPGEGPHADFAVLVEDNSMEPTYRKGDVVYIRKGYNVDNGKIAAVVVDTKTTLKRIYQRRDGLMLMSDNPEYEPIFAANSGYMVTRILGVPVGFTRTYREE